MNRRRALVAIGSSLAAAPVAAAGCLAPSAGSPPENGDGNGNGDGDGNDGGNGNEELFDDIECPSFAENADRTVCWHTSDRDAEPIRLVPSPAVLDLDSGDGPASIEFVLSNRSETPVGLNPYAWAIKRRTEEGYEHVAPDAHVEPWTTIEPGSSSAWELWPGNRTPSEDGDQTPSGSEDRTPPEDGGGEDRPMPIAHALDPGTYVFGIVGAVGSESEDPTGVEYMAPFRIE